MICNAREKKLNCIRKVLKTEVCEVWTVQDMGTPDGGGYYTLIVVKDHETAKLLMKVREDGIREGRCSCGLTPADCLNIHGEQFADSLPVCREEFCIIYPYQKERPLHQFYGSEPRSGKDCEQVCINLLAECISSGEAWPILYLILSQRQIHMEKDLSVFLSYQLDLTELDPEIREKDCVVKCAETVLGLMQATPQMEKTIGRNLIRKKLLKDGYPDFTELFRDIHMDAGSFEKVKLTERIRDYIRMRRGTIIRVVLILCVLLGVTALLMILSQMIFGDIPFFRIFTSTFETIGRESLLN